MLQFGIVVALLDVRNVATMHATRVDTAAVAKRFVAKVICSAHHEVEIKHVSHACRKTHTRREEQNVALLL